MDRPPSLNSHPQSEPKRDPLCCVVPVYLYDISPHHPLRSALLGREHEHEHEYTPSTRLVVRLIAGDLPSELNRIFVSINNNKSPRSISRISLLKRLIASTCNHRVTTHVLVHTWSLTTATNTQHPPAGWNLASNLSLTLHQLQLLARPLHTAL
ncbi:hypothetical protein EX30DRAFT_175890 [Ascodesmis nigricans]|uniref:Uncharacterized protein n=1 Tax=Ascodesmis nigricans TaxID=341454 RepID=A0A4S2MLG5_9PEZI|nr:hypothetical protein EX30DRAFT_175890 [Ascodesmis nigricans]